MSRVKARAIATLMIDGQFGFRERRNGLMDPREHKSMKPNLFILPFESAIARIVQSARALPTWRSVPLPFSAIGKQRKQSDYCLERWMIYNKAIVGPFSRTQPSITFFGDYSSAWAAINGNPIASRDVWAVVGFGLGFFTSWANLETVLEGHSEPLFRSGLEPLEPLAAVWRLAVFYHKNLTAMLRGELPKVSTAGT